MHQTPKYLEYAVLVNRLKRKGAELKKKKKSPQTTEFELSHDCRVAPICTLYPNNKFI